jgi:hypothetical protein
VRASVFVRTPFAGGNLLVARTVGPGVGRSPLGPLGASHILAGAVRILAGAVRILVEASHILAEAVHIPVEAAHNLAVHTPVAVAARASAQTLYKYLLFPARWNGSTTYILVRL